MVDHRSPPEMKIALFRALFRGREDAYRRDRRKGQLLQENGYFVMRFLTEDVGENLNMVLDAIQRTLFSRRKKL